MFTSGSSHGNAGALGVNAGVLSVGASVAKSDIDLDNQAVVDGSAEIAAADVYVGAGQLKADAVTDSLAAAGAPDRRQRRAVFCRRRGQGAGQS